MVSASMAIISTPLLLNRERSIGRHTHPDSRTTFLFEPHAVAEPINQLFKFVIKFYRG
jgi:hypothetical protein